MWWSDSRKRNILFTGGLHMYSAGFCEQMTSLVSSIFFKAICVFMSQVSVSK